MTALQWLAATTIMTALFWVPYVLERLVVLGVLGALRPVDPEHIEKQALWAQRARRAHYNAIENLVIFATLVLIGAALNMDENPSVRWAAQLYFWSRLVHFPALAFGMTGVRTIAFFGGFAAQVMVAIEIFS